MAFGLVCGFVLNTLGVYDLYFVFQWDALYRTPISVHRWNVRFEVFTAVTMKNVVFWDIKTQFVLHRRHIMAPLQSPAS
jgi:hypothetical protein